MSSHASEALSRADSGVTGERSLSLRAFTWGLTLFLLLNVAVVNGLGAWLSPGGFSDTALSHSRDVLRGVGGDDSWGPMAAALEHVQEGEGGPLYQDIFFDQGIKFQYPPSALFALEAMLLFGDERVRIYDEMPFPGLPPVNDFAGWAFLILAAISSAALLEYGLRRSAGGSYAFDGLAALRVAVVFGLTLTFYPAVKAFTLGQIQLWINALFAAALALFALGRPVASGVLTGLVCLMKPHYGLFALWSLLNREWRFMAALIATGSAGLGAAVLHYGWANHLDYLKVLSFMSRHGESYFANQSINGLLNRLAGLGAPGLYPNVNFDAFAFPPYTPWVYWLTLACTALILIAALARRGGVQERALLFAIMGISLTVASPIAWEHHYGVFLPVFAFAAGLMAGSPALLALLGFSYVLVANSFPITNILAETVFNIFQSYTLAGGLILLIVLHYFHTLRIRRLQSTAQP